MASRKTINCLATQISSGLVVIGYLIPWVNAPFVGSISGLGLTLELLKHVGDVHGKEAGYMMLALAILGIPIACHILNIIANFKAGVERFSSFITGLPVAIWLLTFLYVVGNAKDTGPIPRGLLSGVVGYGPVFVVIGMIGALIFSLISSFQTEAGPEQATSRTEGLPVDSFCGECGSRILAAENFCPSCGTRKD